MIKNILACILLAGCTGMPLDAAEQGRDEIFSALQGASALGYGTAKRYTCELARVKDLMADWDTQEDADAWAKWCRHDKAQLVPTLEN